VHHRDVAGGLAVGDGLPVDGVDVAVPVGLDRQPPRLPELVEVFGRDELVSGRDPGFTLRTYTRLMPSSEDRMRQAVDDVWSMDRSALDVP
jgi:hypothetical protein